MRVSTKKMTVLSICGVLVEQQLDLLEKSLMLTGSRDSMYCEKSSEVDLHLR